ncbi:MAG: O-acetyl-ADP-ribose deacetylase [Planctomycetota bacterium]|nr:O-acetyl-ADP-ribose deacetylase [Planctomycetota bacterium]
MLTIVEAVQGDITKQDVDAIVNAANSALLAGAGVCGAIHKAAGPQLEEECRALGGCPTGEARITKGYNLVARNVIHTVGPVWHGGTQNEPTLLRNCYENSLRLATGHKLKSIAFPAISTGIFGYPFELAAQAAADTVRAFVKQPSSLELVRFVCFSEKDYEGYRGILASPRV